MTECTRQAENFLKKANAKMKIEFVGLAINRDWKETKPRNLYNVTLTTPRGSMNFDFWDSIYNTEIRAMSLKEYVEKCYKTRFDCLKSAERVEAQKALKADKAEAVPNAYSVLASITKYDPGTFEDFCCEFGYDEDSRTAERVYFAVQKEYAQLSRLFTAEEMEELAEIN